MDSHFIDGRWIAGAGPELVVLNPASGKRIWVGAAATPEDVDNACAAARASFNGWAHTPLEQRIAICTRFRDLLRAQAEELAWLISAEVGKPLWEARTEVVSMANKVDISVQSYHARTGVTRNRVAEGDAVLRHRAHGVLGVFGPYNFPGHLPNGHIVPALMAGNTLVFKPSEFAPQTAIRTVGLWELAGVPAGVINLLNGARDTGAALAQHPGLDGILFTGSYQTGVQLHRYCAGRPEKLLVLEMGGNNAVVVWDVADTDAAVHHVLLSAFVSAGQRCTCARRLIVEDSLRGQVVLDRLVQAAGQILIGACDQVPAPFMGPLVSKAMADRLLQAEADMLKKGGKSLLAMRRLHAGTGFVSPGIVDVTQAQGIADEEWFGPLLQVVRVADFQAAMVSANATRFGLASALLSDDAALWKQFLAQSRAGVVNWNRPTTGAASTAPFGGTGFSGNHRPSAYYAADYCAYPVASIENGMLELPKQLSPGLPF